MNVSLIYYSCEENLVKLLILLVEILILENTYIDIKYYFHKIDATTLLSNLLIYI